MQSRSTTTRAGNGRLPCIALFVTGIGCLTAAKATVAQEVRGHWDFENGDLTATVGLDLQYYDPNANGRTASKTAFGTTTSFGIPAIGGEAARVMRFPKCAPDEGYILRSNAPPNGGGTLVNRYTLILDILFPAGSTGWRAIYQSNRNNANDGEFFVNAANGIGISGVYDGNLTTGAWHRLAVSVDLTTRTMAKYIDGGLVGVQTLADGVDGRWSLWAASTPPDWVLLFTDNNDETNTGYVNSIQFRDYAMTGDQIAALGGPSAAGIPRPPPPPATGLAQWDFNATLESSTNGEALVPAAAAPAPAPGVSLVNTTIGGEPAQAAGFTQGTFFRMTHGLPANGGGNRVNQYTLILDVMFPDTSASGWAALWQTNTANTDDGEWFIRHPDMGIGISGNYGGYVPDNVWHRLALVIDNVAGTQTSYVDGQPVQQNTGLGIDGRWALDAAALLFADENGENAAGYVNSVQIRGYTMSAAELAAIGGPTAAGIPLPRRPGGLDLTAPDGGERWRAGSTQTITWTAADPDGIVRIELYRGGARRAEIGQALMSAGQFAWPIAPSIGDATDYTVRISAAAFPDVADVSRAPFEIYGSTPPSVNITKLPMLQDTRADAMTLLWETDADTPAHAVDWGLNDVSENTVTEVTTHAIDASHFVHVATIGPLEAETVYRYRVRSGTAASPVYAFRTAPRRTTPIRIAWAADEQGYGVFRRHVPRIAAREPDLFLFAGDLMPSGTSLSDWQEYWFGPLELSGFSQTTPVLFARGNHDGEGAAAYAYSALPGNEAWFAFTYGNVRFVFLDTNLPWGGQQYAFLEAELASPEAQSAQFRIVCFHKPPYTDLWDSMGYNGEADLRTHWVPLFEQYGVDVVVCGHTHAYSRGDRNGVMYMIVGGAGGALDTVRAYDWGFFDVLSPTFHYNIMDVNRNTLTWTAYDLNDAVLDTYQLQSRTPLAPADLDGDGDVDLVDFSAFQTCFNGPNRPSAKADGCEAADFDGDTDVDLADFGTFQSCFNGPNRPAGCT